MESASNMHTEQRPPAKEAGAGEIGKPEGVRDRAATKALEREQRSNLALLDRVRRLERKCLELQHENAEHRSMYKQMFRILQEAQKWQI